MVKIVLKIKDLDVEKNLKWFFLFMRCDMYIINLIFKCLKGFFLMFFKDYFKVFRIIYNMKGSGKNLMFFKVRIEIVRKFLF